MTRIVLAALTLFLFDAPPARGQQAPQTITIGGASVPLAAQARRERLVGLQELYTVSIYLDGALRDTSRLASPDTPKALRIDVAYEDDLQRRMPVDWRRELVPTLELAATAHLRGTFAPLRRGDVVLVEYAPHKGTTVQVNRATAVSGAHHDLMAAFLDHWLGQRPVSEEMKQALLRSP